MATVRKIALGEFIDTDKLSTTLLDFFGLRKLPKEESGRQLEIVAAHTGPQTGRIVAVSMAMVALIALIAGLMLYAFKSKHKQKFIETMKKIKKAILWNGIIRSYL